MSLTKRLAVSTTAAAALALSGCAGTGNIPSASAPITRSEAQIGAEAHPQLLAEFGGAMSGTHAQYVRQVGQNIAVQSGLGNARESFTVSLVNSPVNNAFAIPGGYVYTTRQLVTLMNNEAELAAVLGHEVGHVAARHSQRRQAKAQQNSLLGVLGAVVGSVIGGGVGQQLGQLAMQSSQLLTLRFSRSQELEADELGIRYLNQAGYDPRAMGTVLRSLAMQNALDARLQGRDDARLPEWASTHPDPASRVQTALSKAQAVGAAGGITSRDTFLTRIDGLIYGDDPEQGIVEGRQFIHPELRLAFTAPQGFYMINSPSAVTISGQSGKAQLTLAPYNGDLGSYVTSVFAGLSEQQQVRPQGLQRTTVNGLPAAYGTARVNNSNSQVDVTVFAYEFANDRAYHFTAIMPAGRSSAFNSMFGSMRRIDAQTAANIQPRHVEVVTVGSGDTVAGLARRMAYSDNQVERFRVLNGLTANENVRAGQKVKIVARGR